MCVYVHIYIYIHINTCAEYQHKHQNIIQSFGSKSPMLGLFLLRALMMGSMVIAIVARLAVDPWSWEMDGNGMNLPLKSLFLGAQTMCLRR